MGLFKFLKRDRQPTAAAAAAISSEQYFKALAEKEAAEQDASCLESGTKTERPQLNLDLGRGSGTITPALSSPPLVHLNFDSPSRPQFQMSPAISLARRASLITRPLSRKSKGLSANSISNLETVASVLKNPQENPDPNAYFDHHPAVKSFNGPLSSPVTSFTPSHKRTSSNFSSSQHGSRTFVDILDAQSVIKHSNLLSRVQATGVRGYGEDVADRNNAVNSFKINCDPPSFLLPIPNVPLMRPSSAREIKTRKQRSCSIGTSRLRPSTAISSCNRRVVSDNTISDSASIISQHRLTAFHSHDGHDLRSEHVRPWTRDLVDASQLDMSPGRQSPSPSVVSRVRAWSRDSQDVHMILENMRGKQAYKPSNVSSLGTAMPQRDLELRQYTPVSFSNGGAPSANLFDNITSGFGIISMDDEFPELHSSSAAPSPQILRKNHRSEVNTEFASTAARELYDINAEIDEEPIPPRSSSTRNWSVSSTTPTSSSLHSGTAPRPRTSYTENTSIEVPASPDAALLAALSPKHGARDATSAYYMKQAQSGVLQSSPIRNEIRNEPHTDVEISYSSDDDDDDDDDGIEHPVLVPTRLHKAALDQIASEVHVSEEHLLFRDTGFGLSGSQLPGLFETIPEIPSDSPPRHLSIKSVKPQRSHHSHHSHYSLQSNQSQRPHTSSHRRKPAPIDMPIDHFADFDYGHDQYDLPPLAPMESPALESPKNSKRGSQRLASMIGSTYSPIEAEILERAQMLATMKMKTMNKRR